MATTACSAADRAFASFEPLLSVSSKDLDEVSEQAGMSDEEGSGSSSSSSEEEGDEQPIQLPVRRGGKGLMMLARDAAAASSSSSSSSTTDTVELTQLVVAPAPAVLAPSSASALVVAPTAHFNSPEDIFRAFATMTHCQAQSQTQFLTYTTHFQRNMLDMQAQQAELQTKQETLQDKQEVMQQSIEKMERTMQDMREENTAVKNNRELRLLLEFIVQYGMDSVRGVVVAFPFVVEGALCLVVNVPLLFGAMKAFIPHQLTAAATAQKGKKTKSSGWTRRDVFVQLLKLEFLDYKKCHNKNELFDLFESVFGVEERHAKRNNLDNYVVLLADKLLYAYRTCKENHTFLKPWVERDVMAQRFKGGLSKVISEDAAEWKADDEPALDTKMAWGHEVQKEVLRSKGVRLFYQRMYELAGTGGSSSSSAAPAPPPPDLGTEALMAEKWKRPFHFMGLKPVFRKTRSRQYLFEGRQRGEEDDALSSGGEAQADEGEEDSSDSEEASCEDAGASYNQPGFARKQPRVTLEELPARKKMRKSSK